MDYNAAINNIKDAINSNSIGSINKESLDLAIHALELINSLKLVEFDAGLSTSDGYLIDDTKHKVVLLYNTNAINNDDLNKVINNSLWEIDPRVISITEAQANYINMNPLNKD